MTARWRRVLVHAALTAGVVFRIAGALANTAANDDHMEVIRVIAVEHRLPAPDEFWESFQPPLFHAAAAGLLMALPALPAPADIRAVQMLSCAAGLVTLWLAVRFIRRLAVSQDAADVTIALLSLNPALISISIQATNDAFVVLFATTALVSGYEFFRAPTAGSWTVLTSSSVLACLSKGNGLVVVIATGCTMAAAVLWRADGRARLARLSAAYALVVIAVVPVAGGYVERLARMGNPFATNMTPAPPPALLHESFVRRPGLTSIAHGFLTFRFLDMMRDPLIEPPSDGAAAHYPRHRTSFWSLLYGGANSVHFPYYPEAWRLPRRIAEWLVRVAEACALLPALVLAGGLIRGALQVGRPVRFPSRRQDWLPDLLLWLAAAGAIALVAAYGYRYRDFSTMKGIFVAPAAVAFAAWFARALDGMGGGSALLRRAALASGALLCVAYVLDVGALLLWLIDQSMFLAIV